jgi:adenosine deaminase
LAYMNKTALSQLIKSLPKADLHLHLEGAVTPSILKSLAERYSSELAKKDESEIESELFRIKDRDDLEQVRRQIGSHLRKPEDYLLVLDEIYRNMSEQNIAYAEVFFSPGTRWKMGLEVEEVLEALLEKSARVEEEGGPAVRWILNCLRNLGPESARKTIDLAIRFREKGVVAVGLGGSDKKFSPEKFSKIFAWAKVQGLFVHVHASETDDPLEVQEALEILGANRIGHGIQAARDPKLMKCLRDRATGLDICLTGNALTGAWKHTQSHPFSLLWKRGVPVSLSTDNPGIFNCTLSGELEKAVDKFNLTLPEIKKLCLRSISASFLPYEKKMKLMQKFGDSINTIFTSLQ